MLLIDKIVAVGVGQCGANIVSELEEFEFNPFYINTSLEDLDTIETDKKNKYHIKNTNGMSKDRQQAIECITSNNNAENICYAIYDEYSMAEVIWFHYSLSGGTGGTMGNIIAEMMANLFPDKTINVTAVLPKVIEDVGLQANAIESLNHLKELQTSGVINQVHLLDNNTRDDIFSINKDYAICLSKFINFDQITKVGNLDENERERLLKEPGMGVILDFSNEDFANGLASVSENTIYAKWLKNPTLHGLILNKKQNTDMNKQLVRDLLGMATFTHQTEWDDESNILLSVGMGFNENTLNSMKKNAQDLLEKKRKIEEEAEKEIAPDVDFDTKQITRNATRKRPTSVAQTSTPSRRRGVGEKRVSSILDKYRNM